MMTKRRLGGRFPLMVTVWTLMIGLALGVGASPASAQDAGATDTGSDAAAEVEEAAQATEEAAQDVSAAAADVSEAVDGGEGDIASDAETLLNDPTDVDAWMTFFAEYIEPFLVKMAGAVVLLIVGFIVAGMVARFIRRQGDKRAKFDTTLARFFAQIARWSILALVAVLALGIVGVQTASFAALIAAAGLAVGLALQGSLSNFAAGVMILIFRPYKVGQYITAGGESGTVDEIQLFTTTLDTPDNVRVIVPNSAVFSGNITNYSHHAIRRCDVSVGTEYSADLDRVRQVLEGVIQEIDERVMEKESMVFLDKLGSSSIDWVLRIWVPSSDFWPLKQRITALTKKRLDEAGIGIPFPQMDVHLDKLGES